MNGLIINGKKLGIGDDGKIQIDGANVSVGITTATDMSVDASGFTRNLSDTDNTLQLVANKFDSLPIPIMTDYYNKVDCDAVINEYIMSAGSGAVRTPKPIIDGGNMGTEGSTVQIKINNYNPSFLYTITPTEGITRVGHTISWVLPNVTADTDVTISITAKDNCARESIVASKVVRVLFVDMVGDDSVVNLNFNENKKEYSMMQFVGTNLRTAGKNSQYIELITSQGEGETQWVQEDHTTISYKPKTVDLVEMSTVNIKSVYELFIGDSILLIDGNNNCTNRKIENVSIEPNMVEFTDPFGDGSLKFKHLMNDKDSVLSTTTTTDTNVSYVDGGKFKKAGLFNREDSQIQISSGFPSDFFANKSYSVSLFANMNDATKTNSFFGVNQKGEYCKSLQLMYYGGKDLYHAFYVDDLICNYPLYSGIWYHLCWTYDVSSKRRRIFKDGELIAEDISADIFQGVANARVGISYHEAMDGLIDQVEVYNREITEDEVMQLYNQEMSKYVVDVNVDETPIRVFQDPLVRVSMSVEDDLKRCVNLLDNYLYLEKVSASNGSYIYVPNKSIASGGVLTTDVISAAVGTVTTADRTGMLDIFGDGSGIALFEFNDNVDDASGNYNATWSGTARYDTGKFNKAVKFINSDDDWISFPSIPAKAVSMWIQLGDNEDSDTRDLILQTNNNATWRASKTGNVTGLNIRFGSTYINYTGDYWDLMGMTHLCMCTNGLVWLNNVKIAGQSVSNKFAITELIQYIGNGGNRYGIDGIISQFRVFDRCIDDNDVDMLFQHETDLLDKVMLPNHNLTKIPKFAYKKSSNKIATIHKTNTTAIIESDIDRLFVAGEKIMCDDILAPISDVNKESVIGFFNVASINQLTVSNSANSDRFGTGCAVSKNGLVMVVGAPLRNNGADNTGILYSYKRSSINDPWSKFNEFTATDSAANDLFGVSCALNEDGTACIVGARNAKKLYTYSRARLDDYWTFVGQMSENATPYGFTCSMSTNGLACTVGAYGANKVFTYKRTSIDDNWVAVATITGNSAEENHGFGSSCSMSGDGLVCIVGAYAVYFNDLEFAGQAHTYKRSSIDDNWAEVNTMFSNNPELTEFFGIASCLNEDGLSCLISARRNGDKGENAGKVYAYKRATINSEWVHIGDIYAASAGQWQEFGSACSMSDDGKVIAIGAHYDDTIDTNAGKVYTYLSSDCYRYTVEFADQGHNVIECGVPSKDKDLTISNYSFDGLDTIENTYGGAGLSGSTIQRKISVYDEDIDIMSPLTTQMFKEG